MSDDDCGVARITTGGSDGFLNTHPDLTLQIPKLKELWMQKDNTVQNNRINLLEDSKVDDMIKNERKKCEE